MKVQFKVHCKFTKEGEKEPLGRAAILSNAPDADNAIYHDNEEAATIWILENLRLGTLTGKVEDYVAVPYDEQHNRLEKVADDDRAAAAEDVGVLVKDENVRLALSTMMASRQMYALAMTKMAELIGEAVIEQADGFKRPPHPLVTEMLVQETVRSAQQPFNQVDVFQGLTYSILPWFKKLIEANTQQDLADRQRIKQEEDEARRSCNVPVGIPFDIDHPDDITLARGKSLVLVGWTPAVRYLLDWVTNRTLVAIDPKHPRQMFCVVRFHHQQDIQPSGNSQLIVVGRRHWDRAARTAKHLNALAMGFIEAQIRAPMDLLVVDDLAAAVDGVMVAGQTAGGASPVFCADALKKLQQWASHQGAAFVAGIPESDENRANYLLGVLGGADWERVRTYSLLRPVHVVKSPVKGHEDLPEGKWRIVVGRGALRVDVSPELLTGGSKIITP